MDRSYKQVSISKDITQSSKNAQTISMILKMIAQPLGLHYNHYVSLVRSLGLYYNLARPLGLLYNYYANLSVRLWSVSENTNHGSCTLLSVDYAYTRSRYLIELIQ